MKKIALKSIAVVLIVILGYHKATTQEASHDLLKEKITLFTDRTLYISGEDIPFVAYILLEDSIPNNTDDSELILNHPQKTYSNVVYIELITPEGQSIVAGKFLCENSCGKGVISIPKDVLTGYYYIKAYTKFMRNSGPSVYSYTSLKIVNPLNPDILSYSPTSGINKDSTSLTKNDNSLLILTDKSEYLTREAVNVQIKGTSAAKHLIKGMSISVIPENSFDDQPVTPLIFKDSLINQYYYPETNGISLTGILKDSKLDEPIANTAVNLSVLGDIKDFMAVKTNTKGQFFFKMPDFTGTRNIFICTEMIDDSKSLILVDNDFCKTKVKLNTPAFQLTEEEKKTALQLAQNYQITSIFYKKQKTDSTKYANKAFYGEPQERLILDKYIQLPTLEDYINEIIPTLKIRKQKGKKYFRIYRSQAELEIYKPLVLLDLVAIENPDKVLALSPQNIEYIEVVNSPYIKGDIIYGGIISFFSKKGDFAGIDLPSSGLFLDFNFLGNGYDSPKRNVLKENQPDSRNTIVWNTGVALDKSNSYEQTFLTPDSPGRYTLLLRGITKYGKTFSCKKSILVKSKI